MKGQEIGKAAELQKGFEYQECVNERKKCPIDFWKVFQPCRSFRLFIFIPESIQCESFEEHGNLGDPLTLVDCKKQRNEPIFSFFGVPNLSEWFPMSSAPGPRESRDTR